MGSSGLVLWTVVPLFTAWISTAHSSLLPTVAIDTTIGPSATYLATGDKGFTARPLFFVRGGDIYDCALEGAGNSGHYWSGTVRSDNTTRLSLLNSGGLYTQYYINKYYGLSLRYVDYLSQYRR